AGDSLASADFNGDGFDDLAVGVPLKIGYGAVVVMNGSAAGLSTDGSAMWTQDTPGILDRGETDDFLGASVAAGDFDGDGRGDLAVGVPHEDDTTLVDAGAFTVLGGSPNGIDPHHSQVWTQDSPGILGVAEQGDFFAWYG